MALREELCFLSSCFLIPMSKNSVLEELRGRRLAVNIWNRLPVSTVDFSSLHRFRNSLDTLDVNELADGCKL